MDRSGDLEAAPDRATLSSESHVSASADAGSDVDSLIDQPYLGYDTERVWTFPNFLSMLRLAGVPLMLWLILGPHADGLAVLVLALTGFTDWLDGFLARRWRQRSRTGQLLDPIADRLYILATLLGLAGRDLIPWWLVIALVGRDVMIAFLVPLLRTRGFSSLPVHFLGKVATFSLLYAFPLVLLGEGVGTIQLIARTAGWAFAWWGTGLYWWAGILYVWQAVRLVRSAPPNRGLLDEPDQRPDGWRHER